MTKLVSIAFLAVVAALGPAQAINNGYTVYIVGTQYDQPGIPTVYFPRAAVAAPTPPPAVPTSSAYPVAIGTFVTPAPTPVPVLETTTTNAQDDDPSFIVVLQNDRQSRTLKMAAEDWYEGLVFKITDASGNVYRVTRTPFPDWPNRVLEDCTLAKGERRQISVDFTLMAQGGQIPSWEGLPTSLEAQIVTVVVTFRGYDAAGKFISTTSKPTKVMLKAH